MSESNKEEKKTLGLKGGTLSLKGGAPKPRSTGGGTVVEVKRRRSARPKPEEDSSNAQSDDLQHLTSEERDARAAALKEALAAPKKPAPE